METDAVEKFGEDNKAAREVQTHSPNDRCNLSCVALCVLTEELKVAGSIS